MFADRQCLTSSKSVDIAAMASFDANVDLSNSDRESSDTDEDEMFKEEARLRKEMKRLQEKQRLLKAKRESAATYKQFLASSKVSGGPAASRDEVAERKRRHLEDLRGKLAKRQTLGSAPDWTGNKKPSPVRAPTPFDEKKPAPSVKGKKYKDIAPDSDRAFGISSKAIAKSVSDSMERDGLKVREDDFAKFGFVGVPRPPVIPTTMPHEKLLESVVLPEKLCSGAWKDELMKWDAPTNVDENVPPTVLMKTIFDGMKAMHSRMDLVRDILHLHSVAHIHVIKAGRLTRLFCVADGQEKEAVTGKLVSSLRAVILSSDDELKHLPFREWDTLKHFFENANRVEKLALFLLHYVDHNKQFARNVSNVLLHPDLQNALFWPGDGANEK